MDLLNRLRDLLGGSEEEEEEAAAPAAALVPSRARLAQGPYADPTEAFPEVAGPGYPTAAQDKLEVVPQTDAVQIAARLAMQAEGFRPTPYPDGPKQNAIGYGSSIHPLTKQPVNFVNAPVTKEQAQEALFARLDTLHRGISDNLKETLTPRQQAGVLLAMDNLRNYGGTSLPGILEKDGPLAYGDALLRYTKAKNKATGEYETLPGLEKRRRIERGLMFDSEAAAAGGVPEPKKRGLQKWQPLQQAIEDGLNKTVAPVIPGVRGTGGRRG